MRNLDVSVGTFQVVVFDTDTWETVASAQWEWSDKELSRTFDANGVRIVTTDVPATSPGEWFASWEILAQVALDNARHYSQV
jgi:hypothetical protein